VVVSHGTNYILNLKQGKIQGSVIKTRKGCALAGQFDKAKMQPCGVASFEIELIDGLSFVESAKSEGRRY
jgi:hypothetical protein